MRRFLAVLWSVLFFTLSGSFAVSASPVERFVMFKGAGDAMLAGLLTLPEDEDEAPFPAMLLLQGSGPTDRDGNQLPEIRTNLLRQIARDLAEEGIASLRFDKRGLHANAKDLPQGPAELRTFMAWENFVADAEMGYRWLASDLEIDGERVGVAGHSEGGLIALEISQRRKVSPRALVLLATPGRPFGAVLRDQLNGLLDRQGATARQRTFFLAEDQRIRAAILATGEVPDDVPAGLQALYPSYLGLYFQPLLQLDPAKALEGYAGPALLLAGGRDQQVSPERDFQPLAAVLQSKDDGSAAFIAPEVSHNLKPVKAGEAGFEGRIDAGIKAELTGWLTRMLIDEDTASRH
ncbi:S9 family peptidase [Pelagibius sp. Alg239-R121]|uniref:alpha/beta hydrolase family protein n=1 Tax=Pelagibius sp. Alg239-R121 TaxID=2993448 RepID=UPI0024A63034|nr:alpha/beta fold hydrolase [Pelagibius sp. Alg239-R121]